MPRNEWWEQPLAWFEPDTRQIQTDEEFDDQISAILQETLIYEETDEYSA